jgi:hypothetical protein
MTELARARTLESARRAGGPADGTPADDAHTLVTVQSGLHVTPLPVAGLTVREIRQRFRDRLDIDPNSQARIQHQAVSEDTVVQPGQILYFGRQSGQKGAGEKHNRRTAWMPRPN